MKVYELTEGNQLKQLAEYGGTTAIVLRKIGLFSFPQGGVALLPKRICNIRNCEIARMLKVTSNNTVDTIQWLVPRKVSLVVPYLIVQEKEFFHEDIFPPTQSGEPALSAQEWIRGQSFKSL